MKYMSTASPVTQKHVMSYDHHQHLMQFDQIVTEEEREIAVCAKVM